jgi:molybdopterin synthase sulfur carrier subunit
MMAESITVTYRGGLGELAGRKEEAIQAETVKDVLAHIKAAYGANAQKEAKAMLITVNGKSILKLDIYKTRLAPGDAVSFLPICAGG